MVDQPAVEFWRRRSRSAPEWASRTVLGAVVGLLLGVVACTTVAPVASGPRTDPYYELVLQRLGEMQPAEAFELFARSAEAGNAVSRYNVAMMYANGEGVNPDYQQAAYWFGQAAAQNLPAAQYRLGEMHYFGLGGAKESRERAFGLFLAAAEGGDIDAQLNAAVMLGSGDGASIDPQAAREWLARAARSGEPLASDYLAALARSESGVFDESLLQDHWAQQRAFWIDSAAARGVREAAEKLQVSAPETVGS